MTASRDEVYSILGSVVAVDEAQRTCKVEPLNGDATIYRVRLQASPDQAVGTVHIPKVGSKCIVTWLNKETGYLALIDEVDKTILTIDGQEIELTGKGLSWKKDNVSLKGIFDELIATLKAFQLVTNNGPTVQVMPHIVTRLEKIKSDYSKLIP